MHHITSLLHTIHKALEVPVKKVTCQSMPDKNISLSAWHKCSGLREPGLGCLSEHHGTVQANSGGEVQMRSVQHNIMFSLLTLK